MEKVDFLPWKESCLGVLKGFGSRDSLIFTQWGKPFHQWIICIHLPLIIEIFFITLWNFPFYFLSLPFLGFNFCSPKCWLKPQRRGSIYYCFVGWLDTVSQKNIIWKSSWTIWENGGLQNSIQVEGEAAFYQGKEHFEHQFINSLSQWPAQAAKDWVPLGFRHQFWYLQRQLLDSALNC